MRRCAPPAAASLSGALKHEQGACFTEPFGEVFKPNADFSPCCDSLPVPELWHGEDLQEVMGTWCAPRGRILHLRQRCPCQQPPCSEHTPSPDRETAFPHPSAASMGQISVFECFCHVFRHFWKGTVCRPSHVCAAALHQPHSWACAPPGPDVLTAATGLRGST